MSKEVATRLVHALLVGIECGIVIAVYVCLTQVGVVQQPLYWACFIMIPCIFMFGGKWEDVPFHCVNILIGLVLGGMLTFAITQALVSTTGLVVAFAIATCVGTFLVQGLTNVFMPGGLKPFWGRTPMAFIGMIACFAAGGQNLLVAAVSLLVGIVTSTVMCQSYKLAAKIVGNDASEADAEEKAA